MKIISNYSLQISNHPTTMYRELSDDEDFDELDAVQFRVKSRSQPSGADDPGDLETGGAPPGDIQGQEAPPAEEEPEEEEYEVERILNKRIKKWNTS